MRAYLEAAMPNAKPPRLLPTASVEAILAIVPRAGCQSPELIEGLRLWLAVALERAIRRARVPLTMDEVERLDRAYREFKTVVEALQDRSDPPPRIPVSHGSTDWEHWLSGYQVFGFRLGRRESRDWKLIGALIALYELVGGKPASAAQARGPTMRFLKMALRELAANAPSELRSHFAPPNAEALRKQLPQLRTSNIASALKTLTKIVPLKTG